MKFGNQFQVLGVFILNFGKLNSDFFRNLSPPNPKQIIMERNVLLILVSNRKESAETVQKILTGWGCFIKTRLGIHDGVLENCTESGLIFLEVIGEHDKNEEIARKLNLVKGVHAEFVHLKV